MEGIINVLRSSGPLLLQGALMTISLWLVSVLVSMTVGTVWGIIRCSMLRIPFISGATDTLTFVLRGVPFYVQLLIAYFVLPALMNIDVPPFLIASVSLGLCSAAYTSQMIKGGLNTVPIGQWEAARVLGFSQTQTIRYVLLPQLLPAVLPSLVGECDQVLKSTSIFSTIGMLELTRTAMNIIARQMNPIPVYFAIASIYLMVSALLNWLAYQLEKKLNKRMNV